MVNFRFDQHNLVKVCTLGSCQMAVKCDCRYHVMCVSNSVMKILGSSHVDTRNGCNLTKGFLLYLLKESEILKNKDDNI